MRVSKKRARARKRIEQTAIAISLALLGQYSIRGSGHSSGQSRVDSRRRVKPLFRRERFRASRNWITALRARCFLRCHSSRVRSSSLPLARVRPPADRTRRGIDVRGNRVCADVAAAPPPVADALSPVIDLYSAPLKPARPFVVVVVVVVPR